MERFLSEPKPWQSILLVLVPAIITFLIVRAIASVIR